MKTKIYEIKDLERDYDKIVQGATLIREGQVVAFPTETVYGLGANALDGQAVEKIFKAKGRPNDNPLIVHIADFEDIRPLVISIPGKAILLAQAFWPGPLTIILKKSSKVPNETTAGLETVAIRMPKNAIALALIRESGLPIAAPSANRSGRPSPTRAVHVVEDLNGRIPLILDGIEPCKVGLESTVLDLTGHIPTILRPGGITPKMIEEIIGEITIDEGILKPLGEGQLPKAPGMKYTHYSPEAKVIIYRSDDLSRLVDEIGKTAQKYVRQGIKTGILATDETLNLYHNDHVVSLGSREKPDTIAYSLFSALREADELGIDIILAEWIDEKDEGLAVMNRMIRAAGFTVVDI